MAFVQPNNRSMVFDHLFFLVRRLGVPIKRLLVLGGASGRALYFPGAIVRSGMLSSRARSSLPLGMQEKSSLLILHTSVAMLISYFPTASAVVWYSSQGLRVGMPNVLMLVQGMLMILLSGLVLYRRNATRRS